MTSVSTFAILLGGVLVADARVRALVAGARVIAADGGIRHASALGLDPELWVGDFDSVSSADLATWCATPRRSYPAEKDLSDGEIAIQAALEAGARRLVMLGALAGDRSDHALLHLLQALALSERGIAVVLSSGEEEAMPLLPGTMDLDLPTGSLFSILAFSELTDLSVTAVKYPLDRVCISLGASRTLSNVALGRVRIALGTGRAMVIARPHDMTGA